MKKRLKKGLVFMAALMMLTGVFSTAALASAESRAAVCQVCGKGSLVTDTTYGSWVVDYTKPCDDGHYYGYDIVYKRSVTKTTKCNVCQKGSSSTTTQTKEVCKGSDTP